MQIKVNKEIRDYTESIVLGLSAREFIFSALACAIAVGSYFLFINSLGTELTTWICMLSDIPFAALGFITFQHMNAEQIVITVWRSFLLSKKHLIDQPFNLYKEIFKDYLNNKKKEALGKNDKKLFKTKQIKQR